MLSFYDEDQNLLDVDPLRLAFDGRLGGPQITKVYIRNNDAGRYYEYVRVRSESTNSDDFGPLGNTGWSIKLIFGEREPTEAEWAEVSEVAELQLPDIGDTTAADTFTYYPVWIRVFCPGNQSARIRRNSKLIVRSFSTPVGA